MRNISIHTVYHGPTDTRGSVIVAKVVMTADDGHKVRRQRTVPYDHRYHGANLHEVVARAVATTLGWHGDLAFRELRGGTHYEFKGCGAGTHLTINP